MLRYTKLEGCGNDFVVVDLRRGEGPTPVATAEAAEALCDRHFGIGADGVLAILPPTSEGAVARMRVINADGSDAEMCGNGIRCVAKFLYERDPAVRAPDGVLPIDTGAGLLRCGVTLDARRHVTHVSVDMGRPRLTPSEVPVSAESLAGKTGADAPGQVVDRVVDEEIVLDGRRFRFTAVSMGNPHAVIFVAPGDNGERESLRAMAEKYGPALEKHPWFPRRTNAEFARVVEPGHIELVVWERGCGITLACGTGACATAVAACLNHHASTGEEIRVSLPGGDLFIQVDEDASGLARVTMRGPADEVFEGELALGPLLARHQVRKGPHAAG